MLSPVHGGLAGEYSLSLAGPNISRLGRRLWKFASLDGRYRACGKRSLEFAGGGSVLQFLMPAPNSVYAIFQVVIDTGRSVGDYG